MDTSMQVTAGTGPARGKRQRWTIEKKRRIVEETLTAGTSVARVARGNGVNANQVFYWRKLYQDGRLGGGAVKLLPVRVSAESSPLLADSRAEPCLPAYSRIHIELRDAQVRIEGSADAALLRVLLECLQR
jgi:transposase